MIASLWVATGILALAVILGLIRVATATDSATRAVVGDLVFFACIGLLVIQGLIFGSAVSKDLAMIGAILGILATIALARILTRGRR